MQLRYDTDHTLKNSKDCYLEDCFVGRFYRFCFCVFIVAFYSYYNT